MGSPEWLMPLLPWGKPEIFRIEARAALPHCDTQSPSPSTYPYVFEVSGENGAAVRPQAGPEDPFAELPLPVTPLEAKRVWEEQRRPSSFYDRCEVEKAEVASAVSSTAARPSLHGVQAAAGSRRARLGGYERIWRLLIYLDDHLARHSTAAAGPRRCGRGRRRSFNTPYLACL
jgi:hypothetical protein